jgi:hypothetical protein
MYPNFRLIYVIDKPNDINNDENCPIISWDDNKESDVKNNIVY